MFPIIGRGNICTCYKDTHNLEISWVHSILDNFVVTKRWLSRRTNGSASRCLDYTEAGQWGISNGHIVLKDKERTDMLCITRLMGRQIVIHKYKSLTSQCCCLMIIVRDEQDISDVMGKHECSGKEDIGAVCKESKTTWVKNCHWLAPSRKQFVFRIIISSADLSPSFVFALGEKRRLKLRIWN